MILFFTKCNKMFYHRRSTETNQKYFFLLRQFFCEKHLRLKHANDFKDVCIKKMLLSKALTCMNFYLYKTKMATLSWRRIHLAILLYGQNTSHTDHFTPQHTAFEHSAACLSVVFELLPGFIPFTILWHIG